MRKSRPFYVAGKHGPIFGHRAVWLCGKWRRLPFTSGEARSGSLAAYALSLALFACLLLVVITR